MVREKVGFLQRFLGSIGKRLLWWRAEKMDLFVLALMARETVRKYEEILGDTDQAVETLKIQFAESAKTYLMSFMNQLKLVVSTDLSDIQFMSNISLYSIMGKNYRKFFSNVTYIPADDPNNEEHAHKFITYSPKCLMCSVLNAEDGELLKDTSYGEIISYALGSLFEIILDYVGYNYKVVVKETKCVLRGDPFGEVTMSLHEKEE